MLVGVDLFILQHVALSERRQAAAIVVLGVVLALFDDAVFVVAALFVNFQKAVEGDDGAVRAQAIGLAVAAFDLDLGRRLFDIGGRHLARNRALPDELVKCRLILFHKLAHGLRLALGIGRADGFMRFLRVLGFRFVLARKGCVIAAILGRDHIADLRDGFGNDLHAVSTHVGDETDRLAADIDTLVQALCNVHRLLGREAEFARRIHLQRRGCEWRIGIALGRFLIDAGDAEIAFLNRRLDGVG